MYLLFIFCKVLNFTNLGELMFSEQFKKVINYYLTIGYDIDVMRQTAYLVIKLTKANNFTVLFNCSMEVWPQIHSEPNP